MVVHSLLKPVLTDSHRNAVKKNTRNARRKTMSIKEKNENRSILSDIPFKDVRGARRSVQTIV